MTPQLDQARRYYGKYRGTVVQNADPYMMGRIQCFVEDVLGPGIPSSWAMPCLPVAGTQAGMFTVPPIGGGVWVEFEQGNPDHPIWVGGYFSQADVPALARTVVPPVMGMTLQTTNQNLVQISDLPPSPVTGGIVLKSTIGAMIVVNDSGIYIQNGKGASIMLTGPTVTINNGALVIV